MAGLKTSHMGKNLIQNGELQLLVKIGEHCYEHPVPTWHRTFKSYVSFWKILCEWPGRSNEVKLSTFDFLGEKTESSPYFILWGEKTEVVAKSF